MSSILLWLGLLMILAFPILELTPIFSLVGAIIMLIGVVLLILKR
jgi:hypothetical protein